MGADKPRRTASTAIRLLPAMAAQGALLVGCASLPTNETAAFKTVSTASQTAFTGLADAEFDAVKADQFAKVAARAKRLALFPSCTAATASVEPCLVVVGPLSMTSPDQGLKLVSRTQRVRLLAAGVGDYAGAMSDLAAAADLEAANTAAAKAATSLKGLVTVIDPAAGAVAGPLVDGLVFANRQLQVKQRRKLLLTLATAAQPVMDGAAKALGREAVQLRRTLIVLREKRLMTLKTQYDDDEQKPVLSKDERATLVQDIAQAASDLSAARAIQTDFTPLAASHRGVLAALANPKVDVNQSVLQAQAFLTVLQSLAGVAAPAAPAAPPAVAAPPVAAPTP